VNCIYYGRVRTRSLHNPRRARLRDGAFATSRELPPSRGLRGCCSEGVTQCATVGASCVHGDRYARQPAIRGDGLTGFQRISNNAPLETARHSVMSGAPASAGSRVGAVFRLIHLNQADQWIVEGREPFGRRDQVPRVVPNRHVGWLIGSPRIHGRKFDSACTKRRHRLVEIAYDEAGFRESAPGLGAGVDRIVLLHQVDDEAAALEECRPRVYGCQLAEPMPNRFVARRSVLRAWRVAPVASKR
jgi:hypothetical protein